MFRRLWTNMPGDPTFSSELTELGFKITDGGEFVDNSEKHFEFFHTDNERANEVRKEAMHTACRKAVLKSLNEFGIGEIFVNDQSFVTTKPETKHITMLTTEPEILARKKDVIVIIGEHTQDAGIWAYRLLMRDGGMMGGSAVGLMAMLRKWGMGNEKALTDILEAEDPTMTPMQLAKRLQQLADANDESGTPGVIMLNTGQLKYSPLMNTNMTQDTWLARTKQNALLSPYRDDDYHNRIRGHGRSEEHIKTAFEFIIPKLTHESARLYVVAISDGAETLLTYLSGQQNAKPDNLVGGQIKAIALMQPSHHPAQIKSPALTNFLAVRGRSWVMSDEPQGTHLKDPPKDPKEIERAVKKSASNSSLDSGLEMPLISRQPRKQLSSSPLKPTDVPELQHTPSSPGTDMTPEPDVTPEQPAKRLHLDANLPKKKTLPYFPDGGFSELPYQGPSLLNGVPGHTFYYNSPSPSPGTSRPATPTLGYKGLTGIPPGITIKSIDKGIRDAKLHKGSISSLKLTDYATATGATFINPADYSVSDDIVSSPTYSAGIDDLNYTECVWPAAMASALDWFREVRAEVHNEEQMGPFHKDIRIYRFEDLMV